MANTNQILPFGTGAGANVLDPAVWAAQASRQTGFQAGVAQSAAVNTAIRQASFIAAMIAQFTADYGAASVLDDGNLAALESNFLSALVGAINAQIGPGATRYTVDTGAANALSVDHLATLVDGQILVVNPANTNTGATTINVGIAAPPVLLNDGATALVGGEIIRHVRILLVYDATLVAFRLINPHVAAGGGGTTVTAVAQGGLTVSALQAAKIDFTNVPAPVGAMQMTDAVIVQSTADGKIVQQPMSSIIAATGRLPGQLLATTGYQILPGGLIMQWGHVTISTAEAPTNVTFPIAFPTACFNLQATAYNPTGDASVNSGMQIRALTTTGATLFVQGYSPTGPFGQITGYDWSALGN